MTKNRYLFLFVSKSRSLSQSIQRLKASNRSHRDLQWVLTEWRNRSPRRCSSIVSLKEAQAGEQPQLIIPPRIMSAHKDFVAGNKKYVSTFDKGHLPIPPTKKLIVGKVVKFTVYIHTTHNAFQ